MDRARAVLAEIDLVDVRVQQVALVVAQLERHRHEGFSDLAPPGREAAARVRQEVAAHELLRQRARAFANLAGRDVDEHRAHDGDRVDAEVAVETPVLDGLQRVGQERRDVAGRDDEPVLAVRREQAADQERIQAHDRGAAAARVAQRRDAAADERDRDELLGLRVAGERETARRDLDAAQAHAIRAGPDEARILAVAEALELGDEVLDRQRAARVELERGRVDLRRDVPAAALELAGRRPREIAAVGDGQHEADGREA